ncbi:MAG: HlyD family efflux transporter periplasmic adaptor subunit [Rubrivivax sp.]
MKRSTLITAVAVGATALALLAWAFAPRPLPVELGRVGLGPFETTIDEDGRTRLADRYVVSAPLAGRLARIALREGDAVEAGAVLATLQPVLTPLLDERSRREQQARADGAQSAVRQADKRGDAARVALERARDELKRSEQLAQQGFVSPNKLADDRLAVQGAQKELEAAVEGAQVARHELALARVALGVARAPAATAATAAAPAAFELRAPVAGRVLKLHQSSEATVALGAPLIEIGDTRQLEIVAELLTTDALQARPGSPVRVERWGGPAALDGRVRRVEPAAFTKVSALGVEEQRVNVIIDITSPREQWAALGDGYRVGVRVLTRSEPKVLKLPVGAVFPQPAPAQGFAAFAVDGGRARLVPVRVLARNGSEAWIDQGLAEGQAVVLYPPATLVDGARVAERR